MFKHRVHVYWSIIHYLYYSRLIIIRTFLTLFIYITFSQAYIYYHTLENTSQQVEIFKPRCILLFQDMEPPPKPGNKIIVRKRTRGLYSEGSTGTGSSTGSSTDKSMSPRRTEHSFVNVSRSETSLERFKILLANWNHVVICYNQVNVWISSSVIFWDCVSTFVHLVTLFKLYYM